MKRRLFKPRARVGFAALLLASASSASAMAAPTDWTLSGKDLGDTHSTTSEHKLSPLTVSNLQVRWVLATTGHVSATPAVVGQTVYVPDAGGSLWSVDRRTGKVNWQTRISSYSANALSFSRTTPAIKGDLMVIGDQATATIFAINRNTGALVWKSNLDTTQGAIITSSPTIDGSTVFAGVSSTQETLAEKPGFTLSFRGQVAALDLQTGKIIWRLRTVPAGYTGGAVWGSSFAVQPSTDTVFIPVGNNYSVPAAVQTCQGKADTFKQQLACVSPADHYDSILALDEKTGAIKWSRIFQGPDVWTLQCVVDAPGGLPCPSPAGPDYDFGSGPNLFKTTIDGRPKEVLGAGQKSGVYWALDPRNGDVIWATQVGPGASLGGIEYGASTDGVQVYTGIGNSNHLGDVLKNGKTVTGGFWNALDASTGQIKWQTPAIGKTSDGKPALANGSVSVANGVMYGEDHAGFFVALDALTGKILWDFQSGGSSIGGPAISDGWLFWGSGYKLTGTDVDNNKLYAFSLPGSN